MLQKVTRVIPLGVEHAGAGTTVVDHAFDDAFLERLDELWKRLPLAPKQKASPTDRAYYHDVTGLNIFGAATKPLGPLRVLLFAFFPSQNLRGGQCWKEKPHASIDPRWNPLGVDTRFGE